MWGKNGLSLQRHVRVRANSSRKPGVKGCVEIFARKGGVKSPEALMWVVGGWVGGYHVWLHGETILEGHDANFPRCSGP